MTLDALIPDVLMPALILLIGWLMPSLTHPTLQFGVRIPPDHTRHPVIHKQRRRYQWWVAIAGGALISAGLTLALLAPLDALGALTSLAALVVLVPGYLRARHVIRAAKQRERWYEGLRQGVAVDTSVRTQPEHFPWLWVIPALLVLGVTVTAGMLRYPDMPAVLVQHYNRYGVADRVGPKSVTSAFSLVFVQAGVTALILVLTLLAFRSRPAQDAAAPVAAARRYRAYMPRMAKALLVMAACTNLSMFLTAWQIWDGTGAPSVGLAMLPVVVGLVVLIGIALRTGQNGSRLPGGEDDENTGFVEQDDDKYWRGAGSLYVNRRDPAVFVPKRFGIGWTINFGNPRSLFFLAPVLIAVVVSLLVR
jgi:uncharacterized membrane protein